MRIRNSRNQIRRDPLQFNLDVVRRLITFFRILLQARGHHMLEGGWPQHLALAHR